MAGRSSAFSPERPATAPVSVWLSRLPVDPDLAALTRCLGPDEQARLDSLAGVRQQEFALSRWLIRQALARVSGQPPEACAPVPGRPVRSARPGGWTLSLSHSHGVVACALSTGAAVGVDLEPQDRAMAWQAVARRWFSTSEQAWLLAGARHRDFLRVWTLKEAWLKATGRGIAGHLQTLEVGADGHLWGDDRRHSWHACTGEVADMVLAVAHSLGHEAGAPPVYWLAAPALAAPAGPEPLIARVDWWTNRTIDTEARDDDR